MIDGSGRTTGKGSTTTSTLMLDDNFAAISDAAMKAASPAVDPSVATSSGPETVFVSRGYQLPVVWVSGGDAAVGADMANLLKNGTGWADSLFQRVERIAIIEKFFYQGEHEASCEKTLRSNTVRRRCWFR